MRAIRIQWRASSSVSGLSLVDWWLDNDADGRAHCAGGTRDAGLRMASAWEKCRAMGMVF